MKISYLLDTDTASFIIKGTHSGVNARFQRDFAHLAISSITVAELYFGAVKRQSEALTVKVNAFCRLLPIYDWGVEEAAVYARIRAEQEKAGTPLANLDMMIAASAICHKAVLVTNNAGHFSRIKDLRWENWIS